MSDYNDIIAKVVETIADVKDIKRSINLIMKAVGQFYDLSRIYVFEYAEDNKRMNNIYEWCADDVKSMIKQRQGYPIIEMFGQFSDEPLIYDDVKELKKKVDDRYNLFDDGEICSIMLVPIMDEYTLKGFIGYNDNRRYSVWNADKAKKLYMISKLICVQILKQSANLKYSTERKINEVVTDSQQISTYAVDVETNEIIYTGSMFKNAEDGMKAGDVCYKAIYNRNSMCRHCPLTNLKLNQNSNKIRFFDEKKMRWLDLTATRMKWHDNRDAAFISVSDISNYVEQISYKDKMTGAPTLNKFVADAKILLDKVKDAEGFKYAIAYLDISKFKYINETFGYSDGDEILKTVVECISRQLGDYECFCRATDDKFIMMLRYDNEDEMKMRLDYLFKDVNNNKKGLYKNYEIVIICGIYFIKRDDVDLNYIIDKANIARKNVKENMESCCEVYDEKMHQQIARQKIIESRMVKALEDKEFIVYIQPKNRLTNGEVVGAEALVRWRQSDGEIVPPNEFIPIFENNGFIVELDFYVYERVFEYIKSWIENGIKAVPVSINVSRVHINNPKFTDRIYNLVKKYDIPMNYVELELTESIFTGDNSPIIKTIKKLKDMGFKLSMDDFGSAYSSLNLLKELPFDIIKLDKEFLGYTSKEDDNRDKTIIIHVIQMSKALKMTVICEGVETMEQVEFLRDAGCDYAQGYYFGRPCPEEDFRNNFLLGQL